MNIPLFILIAWFAPGAGLAILGWWYMKTHEQEMVEKDPEFQIFGCIPPPIKWSVVLLLLFGPWCCCALFTTRYRRAERKRMKTIQVQPRLLHRRRRLTRG